MSQCETVLKSGEDAEMEYFLGMSALQLSEFELAEKALTKSIDMDDVYPSVYYYRGICRLSLEKYGNAADDFTKSIKMKSMVQNSYLNRGICRLMIEKPELGLTDIRIAADMEDDAEAKIQANQLYNKMMG